MAGAQQDGPRAEVAQVCMPSRMKPRTPFSGPRIFYAEALP